MFTNCGKVVQTLCFNGDLLTRMFVDNIYNIINQWNTGQLSTKKAPYNTQTFPRLLSLFYPCLNTFFTQFPQRLLLPTLSKN